MDPEKSALDKKRRCLPNLGCIGYTDITRIPIKQPGFNGMALLEIHPFFR